MRTVRNIIAVAAGLMILSAGCTRREVIPYEPPHFITDPVFRAYCEETFDYNEDGRFSKDEATMVEELDIRQKGIGSLAGIEYFALIKKLTVIGNPLGSLSLHRYYSELTELKCADNELETLDISGCRELILLDCSGNRLAELDISESTRLKALTCRGNPDGMKIYVRAGFDPGDLDIYEIPDGAVIETKTE